MLIIFITYIDDFAYFQMMRSMGGLGGGDTKPNFDVDVESDSDDEELPDLE